MHGKMYSSLVFRNRFNLKYVTQHEKPGLCAQQVKCILLLDITDMLMHYRGGGGVSKCNDRIIKYSQVCFPDSFVLAMPNIEKWI